MLSCSQLWFGTISSILSSNKRVVHNMYCGWWSVRHKQLVAVKLQGLACTVSKVLRRTEINSQGGKIEYKMEGENSLCPWNKPSCVCVHVHDICSCFPCFSLYILWWNIHCCSTWHTCFWRRVRVVSMTMRISQYSKFITGGWGASIFNSDCWVSDLHPCGKQSVQ